MKKAWIKVEQAMRRWNEEHGFWMNGLDKEEWRSLAQCATDAAFDHVFHRYANVIASYPWLSNADLIYDVWKLGYIHGVVFDMTPGQSGLWWRRLTLEDGAGYRRGIKFIAMNGLNDGLRRDFRDTGYEDNTFDCVAYDPPYKLNGNPKGLAELSRRYGVDVPTSIDHRHFMMIEGFIEALRISKEYVIVKCQDQVASGVMHWQTDMLSDACSGSHPGVVHIARKVDRFDMLGHHIPQPMKGRKQRHAHGRPSTLLVFKKMMEAA